MSFLNNELCSAPFFDNERSLLSCLYADFLCCGGVNNGCSSSSLYFSSRQF
jgi:hypothetical protein